MNEYKCIICSGNNFKPLFKKGGKKQFFLHRCRKCGIEFLHPVPDDSSLESCYNESYFSQRTDRGYNNYFSQNVRQEIERVFRLNLKDLGFIEFSKKSVKNGFSLDIGCAAGYFVNYMKNLGWNSTGIDVSLPCTEFAVRELKLNVINGNYLETGFDQKFDLITMWATIEHLQNPKKFIRKANNDLKDKGQLYISTCRTGFFNFKIFYSSDWRYYNFPEHIFFFSRKTITRLLKLNGFRVLKYRTYGSGIPAKHKYLKKTCDFLAKYLYLGDMMIIAAEKIQEK